MEKPYAVIEKRVGETPLAALERFRHTRPGLEQVPMAYAGRLDPMASGKLLILIGDECRRQEAYHGLDKEYEFEVLFGVRSDTGDVLGVVEACAGPEVGFAGLRAVCKELIGTHTFPYPRFSSKAVGGKPLHTWTLEGRLDEIEVPEYTARIYKLQLLDIFDVSNNKLYRSVTKKIETIPPATDTRKALGNDFRRPKVHASWERLHHQTANGYELGVRPLTRRIAKFRCTASAGTYMRTLAEVIAERLGTCGLAYSIHRSAIGRYQKLPLIGGTWLRHF